MKHGPRLERELVIGNMRRPERARGSHILERFLERLLRQRVHQIEIEIVEPRRAQFGHRAMRVVRRVNAAQDLEGARCKGLRPERHAVDAGVAIPGEAAAFDGPRVGFQRHFHIVRECDSLPQRQQQPAEFLRLEQTRRAAAEEYRIDPALPDERQLEVEITNQRINVRGVGHGRLQLMRVEIAVRTLAHAPRHVHVQGERRRGHSAAN